MEQPLNNPHTNAVLARLSQRGPFVNLPVHGHEYSLYDLVSAQCTEFPITELRDLRRLVMDNKLQQKPEAQLRIDAFTRSMSQITQKCQAFWTIDKERYHIAHWFQNYKKFVTGSDKIDSLGYYCHPRGGTRIFSFRILNGNKKLNRRGLLPGYQAICIMRADNSAELKIRFGKGADDRFICQVTGDPAAAVFLALEAGAFKNGGWEEAENWIASYYEFQVLPAIIPLQTSPGQLTNGGSTDQQVGTDIVVSNTGRISMDIDDEFLTPHVDGMESLDFIHTDEEETQVINPMDVEYSVHAISAMQKDTSGLESLPRRIGLINAEIGGFTVPIVAEPNSNGGVDYQVRAEHGKVGVLHSYIPRFMWAMRKANNAYEAAREQLASVAPGQHVVGKSTFLVDQWGSQRAIWYIHKPGKEVLVDHQSIPTSAALLGHGESNSSPVEVSAELVSEEPEAIDADFSVVESKSN